MRYLFFDANQSFRVGQDSIMVGGFTEPLELRIAGPVPGHVVSEGAAISEDGVLWKQRLTLSFNDIETLYVQPSEDRQAITTISVEPA